MSIPSVATLSLILLAAPGKAPKPTASPLVTGSVKQALKTQPLPVKPLTKKQIIQVARSSGVSPSKSPAIGRTWVDAARPAVPGVQLNQYCAMASQINYLGTTGAILFDRDQIRWCQDRGYQVGIEIRLDAKKDKGYVINCGGHRLRWVTKHNGVTTTATTAGAPTFNFVAKSTGPTTVQFIIPRDHWAEYFQPRVDRCQVAELG